MEKSTTYFKRGLQGYLHQYLNDAVDAGYKTVSEIKKYAENKYFENNHTPLRFFDKVELYKEYFGI